MRARIPRTSLASRRPCNGLERRPPPCRARCSASPPRRRLDDDGRATTRIGPRRKGPCFSTARGQPCLRVCVCLWEKGTKGPQLPLGCRLGRSHVERVPSSGRRFSAFAQTKTKLERRRREKRPSPLFLVRSACVFRCVCVCVCVGGESPKKAKPKNERTKTTRNDEGRGDVIEGGRLADWSPLVGGAGAGRGPGRGPSRCLQCGYSQRVDPSRTVGILFRIQCRRPHGPRPQLVSFFSFFCPFFWFFCRVYRPFACSGASTWKQRSVLLAPPQIESTAVFVSFFFCCQCLFTRPISSLVSRALSKVIWVFFVFFYLFFFCGRRRCCRCERVAARRWAALFKACRPRHALAPRIANRVTALTGHVSAPWAWPCPPPVPSGAK